MAKFKNLQAGTILTVTDEAQIEQYRKHTDRYEEVKANAPKAEDKQPEAPANAPKADQVSGK